MKNTLIIALAVSVGASLSLAQDEIVFTSDFAPEEGFNYGMENPIPRWHNNSTLRNWLNDVLAPGESPQESNGYWAEVFRRSSSDVSGNAWIQSELRSIGGQRNYTVTFDFKPETDPSTGTTAGSANLVIRYFSAVSGGTFQGQHFQQLIDGDAHIGDDGFEGGGSFDEITIGEPDGRGWRTITVSGTTPEGTAAIQFWAVGDNNKSLEDDPNRFFGSFGIDNVTITTPSLVFETVAESSVRPAIEIRFLGESGQRYQISSTEDLVNWTPERVVVGADETIKNLFSLEGTDRRFFQVLTE